MSSNSVFQKILLVLPEEGEGYDPNHYLLQRGTKLARDFGAKLQILQALHLDPALEGGLDMQPDNTRIPVDFVAEERDRMSVLVDAIAAIHPTMQVAGSVTSGVPRSQAILEFAELCEATLIIKASRDEKYLAGIFSNTDWDLLRDAPIPVWLVNDASDPNSGIVMAIELEASEQVDSSLDERVCDVATELSQQLKSPLHTVHAYQASTGQKFIGHTPIFQGEMLDPATIQRLQESARLNVERAAQQSDERVADFLDQQELACSDVVVAQGDPSSLIKQEAETHQAGLIIMGATRDKGRWQRFTQNVTAEPTLDGSPCDVLFVH